MFDVIARLDAAHGELASARDKALAAGRHAQAAEIEAHIEPLTYLLLRLRREARGVAAVDVAPARGGDRARGRAVGGLDVRPGAHARLGGVGVVSDRLDLLAAHIARATPAERVSDRGLCLWTLAAAGVGWAVVLGVTWIVMVVG